jgi:aminoglycoside phosphotransferase
VAGLNFVADYIDAHHETLGLERLGIARRPSCVLLTPRFRRSRHVIVLVLDDGRRAPGLVGKVPRGAGDAPGLAREARNLRSAEPALARAGGGSAPRVLAFDEGPPHPLLLETALPGRPLSPAALRRDRDGAVERVAAWLERLAAATATPAPDDGWYERLVRAPLQDLAARADAPTVGMVARTLARAEILRARQLPLVFEHGDLCHPNLLLEDDGGVSVLDWERAEPAGLPAHDLFVFLSFAAAASRERAAALRPAFFGRTPWAWRAAQRYAQRLALDLDLLAPLLAVSCARSVAADGSMPRHMRLWRLALGEACE